MSQEKEKNKRFLELNQHYFGDLKDLKTKNNVINAKKVFIAKKKSDQWWEDALKRVNNISKPRKS
jgi:hypothetical protein